jgi:hypothetical protein
VVSVGSGKGKNQALVPSRKKGSGKRSQKITKISGPVVSPSHIRVITGGPLQPPDFNAVPTYRMRRRYAQFATLNAASFTLADGHRQFLVATSTTTAVCYVDIWRIKSVEGWVVADDYHSSTFQLQPVGQDTNLNFFNDRESLYTATSRSEAEPAHFKIMCDADSPMGAWHHTTNVNANASLFLAYVLTNGSSGVNQLTLDIEFEYVLNTVGLPLSYNVSGYTGLTAGTLGAHTSIMAAMSPVGINIFS